MTYITDLEMSSWEDLVGGTSEADWIADRNRKFSSVRSTSKKFRELAEELQREGSLFESRPDLLERHASAADWYVSLAGFSMKTLQNISQASSNFGMNRNPKGVVESLRRGASVPEEEREAFCAWVNSEISNLFPTSAEKSFEKALDTVLMILGGRVIGQGQNKSGDIAVDLLKSLLVEGFKKRGRSLEFQVGAQGAAWLSEGAAGSISGWQKIRVSGRLEFELISGGGRPDIRIFNRNVEIAAGEIKGRKDESNAWESWMPSVYSHLRSWMKENPERARLFFGTSITTPMITGQTAGGTPQNGLREMKSQGFLTAAFNLGKISEGHAESIHYFDGFLNKLDALIA